MNTEGILLTITLALWAAGWLVLGRVRRCGLGDADNPISAARLSIIIPARNEEKNLPTLLRSLAAQSVRPHEIIVVNDASTDGTVEVAQQLGARVINSKPLPDGWRGKTWACHQGAQAATGELLLFLDADTWFEPDGLMHVLSAYRVLDSADAPSPRPSPPAGERVSAGRVRGLVFSVGPFHAVRQPYEDLSLFFNFNMVVGTSPHGLFGQVLLVDRESYQRVGGHETVKERILENCFLAERFRDAGIPVRSVTGKNVLSFRMYPGGMRELVAGWTKGFAAGAGQTPRGVLLLVVAWMCGLMFALLGLLMTAGAWDWAAAFLLCVAQVGWFARQIGSFRWWTALLYPVPLVFFFVVFARSSRLAGKQVNWKGRAIHAG